MSQPRQDRLLEGVRDLLHARFPHAWAAYVYGSLARGDAYPGSDLDLALLLPPGGQIPDKLELMASIARLAHRDVDVVSLRDVGLDLIRAVLEDGQPLFIRDEAATLAWEAERMTDYAAFEPRRAALAAMYLSEPLRTRA